MHMCSYVTLAQVSSLCLRSIRGHRHAHLFLSVLFDPSLYFFLQSYFHLFLIPVVPDENSMEDPLCDSRVPRETVRTTWDEVERRKKFSPRASILFSTESEGTDWRKSLYSLKASLATKAKKSLSIAGKMIKSLCDYRHHPVCRGYKSGTDAYMAVVACFDMLMVRRNQAGGRKEGTHQLLFWKKETSKVVYL